MMIVFGILIPFFGTMAGSFMVFFMKNEVRNKTSKLLLGFAAGVMVAASIWSLLLPSIEMAREDNVIAFIPATVGFVLGVVFLLVANYFVGNLSFSKQIDEATSFRKTMMMILAVTLHNIPEGMAVGVIFAGVITKNSLITMAGAFSLAIGIAIQNFPEGAIISMPLRQKGMSKGRAFCWGVLSGVVEPIGAVITILLTNFISRMLPYFLSFAAGAMIYVVVDELIPESQSGDSSYLGIIGVTFGFVLMMILDVSFG